MTLTKLNKEIINCRKCPRLVAWREQVAREKRRVLPAMGLLGQTRSGIWRSACPGICGRACAWRARVQPNRPAVYGGCLGGFPLSGSVSRRVRQPAGITYRGDGLALIDLYTAPVCRCAPPENKPTQQEMLNCQPYLERELTLIKPKVIVVLGRIAFDSILRIYSVRNSGWKFSHMAQFQLPDGTGLLCSYHPSQQNTLTGRLTLSMFDQIWKQARELLDWP